MLEVQLLDMVDNSRSLCKSCFADFFVSGQSGEVISPWSEAPFECCCWLFHPSPRDMRQHPLWLEWRSSGNLWQGVAEHLACCPSSAGSAGGHGRGPVPIALRETFATSLAWLHERYSKGLVRSRHP